MQKPPPPDAPGSTPPSATTIVQFKAPDATDSGPPLDLPLSSTPAQLTELLNTLLSNDEPLPYAFYLTDTRTEITTTLQAAVAAASATKESTLAVTFHPQSLFRVRPVTRCTSTLPGHSEAVLDAAISPDSRVVATASGDATVRLWDPATQIPLRTLSAHTNWVLLVAFSPDATRLASASMDATVRIWDLSAHAAAAGSRKAAPPPPRTLRGHKKWVTALAWQPFHLDPRCTRLVSASKDATLRVWDVARGTPLKMLAGHTAAVTCARWSAEGGRGGGGDDNNACGLVYSASQDRTIKIWHPVSGLPLRTIAAHGHWVNSIALSTDYLLRCGAFATLAPDRAYEPGRLSAADAAQRYRDAIANAGGVERVVTGSDDFTLMLWTDFAACEGSPAGGGKSGGKSAPAARMTGHQQLVNHVAYSPDGLHVASGSFDKSVRLWNGVNGKFICTLRGHVGAVYRVAWSSDSRLLLSASRDSTCKVWDLRSRKLKADLPGHSDEVYTVDWSVDGKCAVSAGKDRTIKLWHH